MANYLEINTTNQTGRVDPRLELNEYVKYITQKFKLGTLKNYKKIDEGYEDFNVFLSTTKGEFLLKMFSQYKTFRHVKDNVSGLLAFYKNEVCIPKLFRNKSGHYLDFYEKGDVMVLACIMEYFDGDSFMKTKKEPTISTIKKLVREIYKINSTEFKSKGVYDVWVVQNLVDEYKEKRAIIPESGHIVLSNAVERVRKVNFAKHDKGLIHNDLNRSNVLINSKGQVRIIDFSVMEAGSLAVELATFLSLFCINPIIDSCDKIKSKIDLVLKEYSKLKRLRPQTLKDIPVLIMGTYAANYLAAYYEKIGKNNNSKENEYWVSLGRMGMEVCLKLLNQ
jgi:Ser/Thr protein kinase RdoA (MazF antagonist)